MNKRIKGVLLSLVMTMCVSTSTLAASNNASTVFPEKEVEKQLQKAENQKLQLDKKKNNRTLSKQNFFRAASTYPRRKGVILVTPDRFKGIIPTGHAAIVYTSNTVVESVSSGVTTGKNDWYVSRNGCYGVSVNGTTTEQDAKAADYCYNQIGKPYNFNYFNKDTRTKFYCSQLVYASFYDLYKINLDTESFGKAIHPMEIVNSNNTRVIYKK